MKLTPIFAPRGFNGQLVELPLAYEVERYSRSVYGGPKQATLQVSGDAQPLWELLNRLRCPVEIWTDDGACPWWGFVSEVDLRIGQVTASASLEEMANRIAVAYTINGDSGKQRKTTIWAEDSESIAKYGIKELLQTSSASSDAHALAALTTFLSQRSTPKFVPEVGDNDDENSATIICRGWWSTLGWRYASVPTRLAFEYSNGSANYNLGAGVEKIGQLVTISDTNLLQVSVQLRKVGAPTADVRVALCSEDGSNPGTELGYGTIAASTIGSDYAWCTITLSAAVEATGRLYIVVSTSQNDVSNYYQALIGSGYDLGVFHIYQSSAWSEVASSDLCFRLYADDYIETSQQARSLATAYGQFLSGVDLDIASGVTFESYRDGDATALYEIEELLTMGTVNARRMLATVERSRRLRIYEEPTSGSPYYRTRDNRLTTAYGDPVRKEFCPVGCWVRLRDVIPSSVEIGNAVDPTLSFWDECEYDVKNDRLTPTPRGTVNPFDLMRVRDG